MSYVEIGYNNLLTRITPIELGTGINNANIQEIIGSGALSFSELTLNQFYVNEDMQSKNFVSGSAGWKIQGNGVVEFQQATISGTLIAGSIHIPDEDTTANSFHVESDGDTFWGCTQSDFTADNDNANAYVLKTGVAKFQSVTIEGGVIDNTSTVGGRTASILSGAIDTSGHFIDSNLSTASKEILGDFTFGASGAIKMITDATNGLWISPTGILGKKAGVTTFAIDTSGNATFSGDIASSTITGTTITGGTVQTATTGQRVVMSSNQIEIFNGSDVSVGTFKGLTGTYASAIQCSVGEIDVLAMNAEAIGFTAITKDALIGVDTGDLRLTTMKSGGTGGDIVLSPEIGQSVISYRNIIPNGIDESLNLGDGTNNWGKVYIGNAGGYLYESGGKIASSIGFDVPSGGETNTASNIGGTYGWFYNKSGVDLRFRGFSVGSGLSVTNNTTYYTLNHAVGNGHNHIPINGSSTQYLTYSSAGTAQWSNFPTIPTGIPSGGSAYQMLINSSSGTASWSDSVYVGNDATYSFSLSGTKIASSKGLYITGDSTVGGSLSTTGNLYTGGASSNTGSVNCAVVGGAVGGITFSGSGRVEVSTHFDPTGAGSYNTGGSTRYWNDVSYKTLTDRGCLGWFDEGVELQDGTIVSDIEALKAIQKHPTKKTVYGVSMLDYKTFPKVSYKKAVTHKGIKYARDKNDEPKSFTEYNENTKKDEVIQPTDGIEMTSIFSIMIGAFKELDKRLITLENNK